MSTLIFAQFRLEELKICFDEALNEYDDKYDIIYFGYSCGLIEYNILENVIQARHIDKIDYDKLQYETRLKIEAKIQNMKHS